jgi:hypothetical protein
MANGFVQVPPDSSGKKMQTFENTVGGNLVEAEAITIVDTAGVAVIEQVAQGSTTAGQTGGLILGAVTTASPAYTNAQTSPVSLDTNGSLRVNVVTTGNTGVRTTLSAANIADNGTVITPIGDAGSAAHNLYVGESFYGGAFSGSANATLQGWSKARTPTVFKTVSATASGNTALWTPASGNKFRLLALIVEISNNANLAAGAVLTVKFQDSAADVGLSFDCFVPTTAVTTTVGAFSTGWIDLGFFGVLSSAANNVLNVNLSATLTTGACRVTASGTEE